MLSEELSLKMNILPLNTSSTTTVAKHLVKRFRELGVGEGFGIVGDFALRLFGRLYEENFPIRVTADEQGAAFAADAFARMRGFGVCAVTYSVGGLKIANATAGAWAEQVPLLVLSGAPGLKERQGDPLLHHRVKHFQTQMDVFQDLTVAQAALDNPAIAASEIDRVIEAILAKQRPGYIEVPRDLVDVPIVATDRPLMRPTGEADPARLKAAVEATLDAIAKAKNIVAVAGEQAMRRGDIDDFKNLVERLSIPFATGSLSKGAISERHPLALGVYMGAVSAAPVVRMVEDADLILAFGVMYSDITMGAFTANLRRERIVECRDEEVNVGLMTFRDVPLHAFLPALALAAAERFPANIVNPVYTQPQFTAVPATPLSVDRVIACVSAHLDERHLVAVDPGECLFASVDLNVPGVTLSSAYYATMGYAVPAALGMGRADPAKRPVVLVGDGAFLMTGLEAQSAAFHGVHPVILVLDNDGYGTQRPMLDGSFNNIASLRAEELPKAFGSGKGRLCETEEELDAALTEAMADDDLYLIRARVPKGQISGALKRLTDALKAKV